jgi:hypothetical protein
MTWRALCISPSVEAAVAKAVAKAEARAGGKVAPSPKVVEVAALEAALAEDAAAAADVVGTDGHCSPRRQTHFESLFPQEHGTS